MKQFGLQFDDMTIPEYLKIPGVLEALDDKGKGLKETIIEKYVLPRFAETLIRRVKALPNKDVQTLFRIIADGNDIEIILKVMDRQDTRLEEYKMDDSNARLFIIRLLDFEDLLKKTPAVLPSIGKGCAKKVMQLPFPAP